MSMLSASLSEMTLYLPLITTAAGKLSHFLSPAVENKFKASKENRQTINNLCGE